MISRRSARRKREKAASLGLDPTRMRLAGCRGIGVADSPGLLDAFGVAVQHAAAVADASGGTYQAGELAHDLRDAIQAECGADGDYGVIICSGGASHSTTWHIEGVIWITAWTSDRYSMLVWRQS